MDKKNGNRRVGAGSVGHVPSPTRRGGISPQIAGNIDKIISGTCRGFARAADWQQVSYVASQERDRGHGARETGYRLSEDHEGLHSGRFISVSVTRSANAVAVRGGYYDEYWQPRTIHRESMPLEEVTAETLRCLLMDMHGKLCNSD